MLAKHLRWYTRHSSLPTTPDDRAVRRLVYQLGDQETELGLVCELARGGYWVVTTSHALHVMPETMCVKTFDTVEEAQDLLFSHVVRELQRLSELSSELPYTMKTQFKARDRAAFERYGARNQESFKQGIDWVLQSEGFPRRPSWARFLVQNRDGSYTWFEEMPKTDVSTGVWHAKDGRSKKVETSKQWDHSITRIG